VFAGGVYGPGIFFDEIFDAASARTPYLLFTFGDEAGCCGRRPEAVLDGRRGPDIGGCPAGAARQA
jgi:hypothetical protein